jgi:hypothetical protein
MILFNFNLILFEGSEELIINFLLDAIISHGSGINSFFSGWMRS